MAFVLEAFFAEMELETSENCEAVGKVGTYNIQLFKKGNQKKMKERIA
mgnify:CR=1 FL=1